jgi:hypothetical protein
VSQSQSGCDGEEKNSQSLLGHKLSIFQLLVQRYTIELSWLLLIRIVIFLFCIYLFLVVHYVAYLWAVLPSHFQCKTSGTTA